MDTLEPILITSLKKSLELSKDLEPMKQLEYILKNKLSLFLNTMK